MIEISRLIEEIKGEAALHRELIDVLQAETANLAARDYKALYETVARKEHLLIRIDEAGRVRLRLMEEAASALGIAGGRPNLTALINGLSGLERAELESHRNTVVSLIESIKEINRVNALIAKGSLDHINKTLGLLGSFQAAGTYRPSGVYSAANLKGCQLNEGV